MNIIRGILDQARHTTAVLLAVYLPTFAALALLVAINLTSGIKVSKFTRDPVQVLDGPAYIGVYSNIGILIWTAAAAGCFFSGGLLSRVPEMLPVAKFFFVSGGITSVLVLDDMFMFHEVVFPEYLGIWEALIAPSYAVMILFYLFSFRHYILKTDYIILGLALICFGFSASIDIVAMVAGEFHGVHLLEDGFKLLGIVGWSTYMLRTAFVAISGVLNCESRRST